MTAVDAQLAQITAGGVTAIALDGRMTLDDGFAPYLQGSVTIPTPANLAGTDPLTADRRVTIALTQLFSDSDLTSDLTALWGGKLTSDLTVAWGGKLTSELTALHSRPWNPAQPALQDRTVTFTAGIRSRTRNSDGTIEISFASDEALMQDYAALVTLTPGTRTMRELVNLVLSRVFPGFPEPPVKLFPDPLDSPPFAAPVWLPGVGAWDYLAPLLLAQDLRLWVDVDGSWRLSPATPGFVDFTGTITLDEPTRWTETLDRDGDWYNSVVVSRETSPGVFAYDSTSSFPAKTVMVANLPPSENTLQYSSLLIWTRTRRRGSIISITAVTDPRTIPGMKALVTIDLPTVLTRRTAAITFDLRAGQMTVTTKEQ